MSVKETEYKNNVKETCEEGNWSERRIL